MEMMKMMELMRMMMMMIHMDGADGNGKDDEVGGGGVKNQVWGIEGVLRGGR